MKVLWLTPSRKAPWIYVLANELIKIPDFELTILECKQDLKTKIEIDKQDGIQYVYLKTPKIKVDLLTLFKVRIKVIREYLMSSLGQYDLIHMHGCEHQYQAACWDLEIPKLLSVQGILSEYKKKLNPFNISDWRVSKWYLGSYYEQKYLRYIKDFSCRTHWDKSFIKSVAKDSNIHHNWEILRNNFFGDYYSEKKEKIIFTGGTNPIKGIKETLIAFNKVKEKIDLKLIIINHTDKNIIKEIITKNKLGNIKDADIDIRGFQTGEQIANGFKESFCMLHPTYIDNSPNSVCEAQVAGLPVIASDVGGVSSLIENKETGILINLKIEEITNSIFELYENDNLRKHISEKSKTIARERHNPETIIQKTLDIYQSLK